MVVCAVSAPPVTDQSLGGSMLHVALHLSPRCCPLETGALVYAVDGKDRWNGSSLSIFFNVVSGSKT